MSRRTPDFESLHKWDLRPLCDRLPADGTAVEECVAFFEAESFGVWHGRARAVMARRFKHVELTLRQRERAVSAVLRRLATGRFSEGFRDQLRFVLCVDPARAFAAARACRGAAADHVRRYAGWVLAHDRGEREGSG